MRLLLLRLLLLLAAAAASALASPFADLFPQQSPRTPPACNSLKCILSSPQLHSLPPSESATLSPSSPVDVLIHIHDGKIAAGRAAAELITGAPSSKTAEP